MTERWPLLAGDLLKGRPTAQIRSPWDDRVVAEVGQATRADVEAAIAAADGARGEMAGLSAFDRASALASVSVEISRRQEELAASIVNESGKPLALARGEVARAAETFSFAAAEARTVTGELVPLEAAAAGRGRIGLARRFPAGPVGAIVPFNFPLNLLAHKVAPALAAGCPVVAKPASQTPSAALLLGEIVSSLGLPSGAISVLPCPSADVAPLVEDERVKVLSFTGSRAVGHAIYRRTGPKRVLLELGGNAAAIVEGDADLELASERIAFGAFAFAGQVCISVQRVLVHRSVYERFVALLADRAKGFPCGDPASPDVMTGPMIDAAAADRVEAWVREALEAGAEAVERGGREGNLLRPVVLAGVDRALPVWSEEAFGPVLCVAPYDDLDDALAAVNESEYGLQAAIFTTALSAVMRAYEVLEVGGLIHDDASTFRVDNMPYGGVKGSGLGREGLKYAIEEMTELRHLVIRS